MRHMIAPGEGPATTLCYFLGVTSQILPGEGTGGGTLWISGDSGHGPEWLVYSSAPHIRLRVL